MTSIALVLNGSLALLLLAALWVGVRLHARLSGLRDSQQGFVKAVGELDQAARRAEQGLADIRAATEEAQDHLGGRIARAAEMSERLDGATGGAEEAATRAEAAAVRAEQALRALDAAVDRARMAAPAAVAAVAEAPSARAVERPAMVSTDLDGDAYARLQALQRRLGGMIEAEAETRAETRAGAEPPARREPVIHFPRPRAPAIDDDLFDDDAPVAVAEPELRLRPARGGRR